MIAINFSSYLLTTKGDTGNIPDHSLLLRAIGSFSLQISEDKLDMEIRNHDTKSATLWAFPC